MRNNGHTLLMAVIVMLTLGVTPRSAFADAKREAADHFAVGVRFIDGGQVKEGLDEFLRAYELSPNYVVLYNIAQARVDLHQYCQAQEALRAYLRDGGPRIPKARRVSVEKQLSDLDDKIGNLDVQVNVVDALISVDGVEIGKSPLHDSLRVDAGEHMVSATASGYLPVEQPISVSGKQRISLRWSLIAEQQPASLAPAATSTTNQAPSIPLPIANGTPAPNPISYPGDASDGKGASSVQRGIGIAASALGVVGVGIGTGYAIRSISKGHQSDEHCDSSGACDGEGIRLNRQAMNATTASIVGFAAGGAALACGLTLILTAPSANPKSVSHKALWISVAANGATLGGSW